MSDIFARQRVRLNRTYKGYAGAMGQAAVGTFTGAVSGFTSGVSAGTVIGGTYGGAPGAYAGFEGGAAAGLVWGSSAGLYSATFADDIGDTLVDAAFNGGGAGLLGGGLQGRAAGKAVIVGETGDTVRRWLGNDFIIKRSDSKGFVAINRYGTRDSGWTSTATDIRRTVTLKCGM